MTVDKKEHQKNSSNQHENKTKQILVDKSKYGQKNQYNSQKKNFTFTEPQDKKCVLV